MSERGALVDDDRTYGACPIRRRRRTQAEMAHLRARLYEIVERDQPTTVRGVFYQAVSSGLVKKTEAEYKSTIGRLLVEMRRAETLPYDWIVDNTRWQRKPQTWSSLARHGRNVSSFCLGQPGCIRGDLVRERRSGRRSGRCD